MCFMCYDMRYVQLELAKLHGVWCMLHHPSGLHLAHAVTPSNLPQEDRPAPDFNFWFWVSIATAVLVAPTSH